MSQDSDIEKKDDQIATSTVESDAYVDTELDKRITWRRDRVLVPLLGTMYLIMFLDRTNIANARIEGLEAGLNMPSNGYNVALSIFYVPFVLFEVPSNLILSLPAVKPRWYLGTMVLLLGVVSMCQGLTGSYGGLLAARFIAGIFEATLPAAATYILSMYYTKKEGAVRFAWFFNFALAGPMFSGLLAYGLVKGLDGHGGYEGWRWIFIIEGLMTVVFGCVVLLVTPNFPEKAQSWFLKQNERERLLVMLEESRGKEGNNDTEGLEDVPAWKIFLDWRIQLFTLAFFCCDVTASSVSAFSPTILTELGYVSTTAQLLTMPVWASGIIASFTVVYFATRANKRWMFVLGSILVQIAGWVIFKVYPAATGVRYLALFLLSMGTFPQMPLILSWLSSNLRGRKYLAVGMAWCTGFGNAANFVSANVFIRTQRPRYPVGVAVGLSFTCLGFATVAFTTALLMGLNRRRTAKLNGLSQEETARRTQKGIHFLL